MHLRRLIWLLLVLASCSGRETALSPAEYYDLGRYARLDGDWNAAVGYFEKALSVAALLGVEEGLLAAIRQEYIPRSD